jgi:hypothetical protein
LADHTIPHRQPAPMSPSSSHSRDAVYYSKLNQAMQLNAEQFVTFAQTVCYPIRQAYNLNLMTNPQALAAIE